MHRLHRMGHRASLTLEKQISQILENSPWTKLMAALQALKGVGSVVAATIIAEVGDFARFAHASCTTPVSRASRAIASCAITDTSEPSCQFDAASRAAIPFATSRRMVPASCPRARWSRISSSTSAQNSAIASAASADFPSGKWW